MSLSRHFCHFFPPYLLGFIQPLPNLQPSVGTLEVRHGYILEKIEGKKLNGKKKQKWRQPSFGTLELRQVMFQGLVLGLGFIWFGFRHRVQCQGQGQVLGLGFGFMVLFAGFQNEIQNIHFFNNRKPKTSCSEAQHRIAVHSNV